MAERLHGTIRQRNEVMRGLDHEDSTQTLLDRLRLYYYNFIRPHQALNGKTPAQKAGINLDLGNNKWLSLMKKASNNR